MKDSTAAVSTHTNII